MRTREERMKLVAETNKMVAAGSTIQEAAEKLGYNHWNYAKWKTLGEVKTIVHRESTPVRVSRKKKVEPVQASLKMVFIQGRPDEVMGALRGFF